jgi:hypothetical protein
MTSSNALGTIRALVQLNLELSSASDLRLACTGFRRQSDLGVICLMSRTGNVWDNAALESFFSSLKTERTIGCRPQLCISLGVLNFVPAPGAKIGRTSESCRYLQLLPIRASKIARQNYFQLFISSSTSSPAFPVTSRKFPCKSPIKKSASFEFDDTVTWPTK